MASPIMCIVGVLTALALVGAEDVKSSPSSAEPRTAAKRGVAGLTGVPGVLYSGHYPSSSQVQHVPVPHPYPVPVPHPVPVQVPRPFPVTVHKTVGLPVPVGVPVPVNVPVPKPYPVPVPVNIPQGASPLSAFGGSNYGHGDFAGNLGASPFGASPFGASPFGTSPFGASPFGASPFGASASGSFAGKLGYGLGVYGNSGTPTLPIAQPGLAAALSSLSSNADQTLSGVPSPGIPPFGDPLSSHPSKY